MSPRTYPPARPHVGSLWRGEPLPELAVGAGAVAVRSRLQELHVLAGKHLAAARTRSGQPDSAVGALEALVRDHPLRERRWAGAPGALAPASGLPLALRTAGPAARVPT